MQFEILNSLLHVLDVFEQLHHRMEHQARLLILSLSDHRMGFTSPGSSIRHNRSIKALKHLGRDGLSSSLKYVKLPYLFIQNFIKIKQFDHPRLSCDIIR